MLPFEPESIEALRARYEAGVDFAWDPASLPDYRPGLQRKHVFDCKDGVRLVITRETNGVSEFVHISASVDSKAPLYGLIVSGRESKRQFAARIRKRFKELSKDKRPLLLAGWSKGKGVPHFKLPLGVPRAVEGRKEQDA